MALRFRVPPLVFEPKGLIIAAVALVVLIIAVNLAQDFAIHVTGAMSPDQRWWLLDLDSEQTIPSWFASSLLLIAAMQLYLIARALRDEWSSAGWLLLAMAFAALSADETVALHEKLSGVVHTEFNTTGAFYFAWVIPAIVVCAIGLILYIPLLRRLPRRIMLLMMVSVVLYLGGAIGMEMVGSGVYEDGAARLFEYRMLATVEESLEFAGVLLFIHTLIRYRRMLAGETAAEPAPSARPARSNATPSAATAKAGQA